MRSLFMRFPGGKAKALTFSYDNGMEQDARLIEIMKKHGLKGTFNLNSGLHAPEGTVYKEEYPFRVMTREQSIALYKDSGMEVAVHSHSHPYLEQLPVNICTREILKDREALEEEFDCIIRGMAYPFATYNDAVVSSVRQCGMAYARTGAYTEAFDIPTDWLRMPPTCHHNNPRLMELAKSFVEETANKSPLFFCILGHSWEFETNNNWNVIEEFAEYMGGREDIWYATNIEVCDYVAAYNQLQFSVDGSRVYNPTAIPLYFERITYAKQDETLYCVAPGQSIRCE